jgi:MinD-like ATPase involved in chromosome partitioning or flagellar assembly
LPAEAGGLAFISLLRDELAARALMQRLMDVDQRWSDPPSFLVPPVRGLEFFASGADQAAVDRWWGRCVPPSAVPVYLLCHEAGLADWLGGLDGVFMVAVSGAAGAAYAAWTVVEAEPETATTALAAAATLRFAEPRSHADLSADEVRSTATPPVAARSTSPGGMFSRPAFPSLIDVDGSGGSSAAPLVVRDQDPLDLLVRESASRERPSVLLRTGAGVRPAQSTEALVVRGRSRFTRPLGRQSATTSDVELAARLVGRGPTVLVVGSRKGGVGKTSHAAGIAIAAGQVLDSIGHSAALVDANIANPDAWGQLNLPSHAATVRDVAAALAVGADPPMPVHSATAALACYPERRDGAEYSRTDIRRLAAHLRARYTLIVVDMSNRLPDPTGGPEATVAAYWLEEADALVLPTATSRQDFNGVLDYLDVSGLPPTVVPYIVSAARRNRRHPITKEYLDAIAARVHSLVPVPDEADRVRLAGMTGAAVQDVSPRMRVAYRELTAAVARLPARARR